MKTARTELTFPKLGHRPAQTSSCKSHFTLHVWGPFLPLQGGLMEPPYRALDDVMMRCKHVRPRGRKCSVKRCAVRMLSGIIVKKNPRSTWHTGALNPRADPVAWLAALCAPGASLLMPW